MTTRVLLLIKATALKAYSVDGRTLVHELSLTSNACFAISLPCLRCLWDHNQDMAGIRDGEHARGHSPVHSPLSIAERVCG